MNTKWNIQYIHKKIISIKTRLYVVRRNLYILFIFFLNGGEFVEKFLLYCGLYAYWYLGFRLGCMWCLRPPTLGRRVIWYKLWVSAIIREALNFLLSCQYHSAQQRTAVQQHRNMYNFTASCCVLRESHLTVWLFIVRFILTKYHFTDN